MSKNFPKYIRRPRRPPLDEDLILSWADEHFEIYGSWPKQDSGQVDGHYPETWSAISQALRLGLRGLLLGSSLAILLEDWRGVPNPRNKKKFTVEDILLWADQYFETHGLYPTVEDGAVGPSSTDTWVAVDSALRGGGRGLSGGSSLALLMRTCRNVRNGAHLNNLSVEVILRWADEHYERTGDWPHSKGGVVGGAPAETWIGINHALERGSRGLPGGCSLAHFLVQHRGIADLANIPPYSIETIVEWMRVHGARHGRYPHSDSGQLEDTPCETWRAVDNALNLGLRGMPGGSSLAKLRQKLILDGELPDLGRSALFRAETIVNWLVAYGDRHGEYPTVNSGAIEESPQDTWRMVEWALIDGGRGLPGGSSLAKLKQALIAEGKVPNLEDPKNYNIEQITAWMSAHAERCGKYPSAAAGAIEGASGETWAKVENALIKGHRGLPGGSSLAKLKRTLILKGILTVLKENP